MIRETFAKSFGEEFAPALGKIIVLFVATVMLAIILSAFLGVVFFFGAWFFYKKRMKKSFLLFGILGSILFSAGFSILLSSLIFHNMEFSKLLMPLMLVLGIYISIIKYRRIDTVVSKS